MINKSEYLLKSKRLEELLKVLTEKGRLAKLQQSELDFISEEIANYEEKHYPFQPEVL